jgi:hypothetical protein
MSAEPSPPHDMTQGVTVMYNVPSYALVHEWPAKGF